MVRLYLVNDIDANGDSPAQIVSLDEALSTPEIAIPDLEFLTTEDIAQMFPGGAACTFTYTITTHLHWRWAASTVGA